MADEYLQWSWNRDKAQGKTITSRRQDDFKRMDE